ncbi:MAG: phosphoribosylaminoimidazolesuccinocarboxamide synthase [Microbacteriaceae bacterium]
MAIELTGWDHLYSGKVRDLYRREASAQAEPVPAFPGAGAASLAGLDSPELLVVASNRVSAFDHVLEPEIPGKGALLTKLSLWWFHQLSNVPNHLLEYPDEIPAEVRDRSMLVKKLEMYPIEAVVRGYLTGSGYKEYLASGTVCGIALPAGLEDGDRLPEPIYTPAFKAPMGEHDENISYEQSVEIVGADAASAIRDLSLKIYSQAAALAEARGLILADTKFEFGADPDTGTLTLGDEVLTSDSSRYWDGAAWAKDRSALSFDKQIVRNWLSAHWDGSGTPPELPAEIVQQTAARYAELFERLAG